MVQVLVPADISITVQAIRNDRRQHLMHQILTSFPRKTERSVESLMMALDEKDAYTGRHSRNVAAYATAIGEQMGWTGAGLAVLRLAGLLHDVGKLAVRTSTLCKPGALDDFESQEMQSHPDHAVVLLRSVAPEQLIPWVAAHHERVDGRGYPNGLRGDQIPLGARILSVADSFDAMTSERPYRSPMPVDAALAELIEGVGSQFDGSVVAATIAAYRNGSLPIRLADERWESAFEPAHALAVAA